MCKQPTAAGTPLPVLAVSACVAFSLFGDGALYVVLPVVFATRGLAPWHVGLLLSANRIIRLFTNPPAVILLGRVPIRPAMCGALLVGALTTLAYGLTESLILLLLARAAWGACWSVLRLSGLITVTDCIDAGLAPESRVGRLTGFYSGVSRLGSAAGMALGGVLCDAIGFSAEFVLFALLTACAAPYALFCAFGSLPSISGTAAAKAKASTGGRCASVLALRAPQWRLFFLAFSASCAGNGLIVSTLGAILGAHATAPDDGGGSAIALGAGVVVSTATLNGGLLGFRWSVEGFLAPLWGAVIDRCGWRRVAPTAFSLSSAMGALSFSLLRAAEATAGEASAVLLSGALLSVIGVFFLFSVADLCVKAMGVAARETPLLVMGDDLGAAVGPLLGFTILQARLPPSSIFAAQSIIHAAAAAVATAAALAKVSLSPKLRPTDGENFVELEEEAAEVAPAAASSAK